MWREGSRSLADRLLEYDGFCGQRIQVRSVRIQPPVGAESIRAYRIDRYQQQIRLCCRGIGSEYQKSKNPALH